MSVPATLRELSDFPIRGGAWITEIGGRHFVIWLGRDRGNQDWAVVYQARPDGRPTTWVELARERTRDEALASLQALVGRWPPPRESRIA